MMIWEYRVIRDKDGEHAIHEVNSRDSGEIVGWTAEPMAPVGDTVAELRLEIEMMLQALDQPVLEECGDVVARLRVVGDGQ